MCDITLDANKDSCTQFETEKDLHYQSLSIGLPHPLLRVQSTVIYVLNILLYTVNHKNVTFYF